MISQSQSGSNFAACDAKWAKAATPRLKFAAQSIGIASAALSIDACCAGLKPVEPLIMGQARAREMQCGIEAGGAGKIDEHVGLQGRWYLRDVRRSAPARGLAGLGIRACSNHPRRNAQFRRLRNKFDDRLAHATGRAKDHQLDGFVHASLPFEARRVNRARCRQP
jgi:hypothetical protein